MNDRHPSGAQPLTDPAPDASYAHYPPYDSYGQQQSPSSYTEYGDGDPLFGSLPGSYETGQYDTGTYATGVYGAGPYDTGTYSTGTYDTGSYDTGTYDTGTYTADATGYATGGYATGAYDTGSYPTGDVYATGQYDTGAYDTGTYATTGTQQADAPYDPYSHTAYETSTYETPAHQETAYQETSYETGSYDALGLLGHSTDSGQSGSGYTDIRYSGDAYDTGSYATDTYDTGSYPTGTQEATGTYEAVGTTGTAATHEAVATHQETGSFEATAVWPTVDQGLMASIPAQAGPPPIDNEPAADDAPSDDATSVADAMTQAMPVTTVGTRVSGPAAGKAVRGRGRRRPAKRSALLTVAVPSVAAMGVCAVAAASVSGFTGDDKDEPTTQAATDPTAVKPAVANSKLDTQLVGLTRGADDFRDRASRTQERIDLKERQALERQRKAEEAARKEALRPKFMLPVKDHGLSALFGQAGVNWMSVHTGIDFPVSYGTPVMAATDGTVRTQWNSAYGNMAIVTASDGTETWYCHLSSTKIRSGSVKAGDTIAYSGNSGNSTGPHLHFEVRPGGESAIDPLSWLRSHDLDPN
ncbi:peptidoglycan DD-metalloendopeptidase family protein [Streptomyces sp. NPDC050636]|uniref:M23 family metallopeptidase n=1 Tax=Streptomyces sp. NPDC050636 TaxID=3154510 RepID=UPI0034388A2B